MQRYTHPSLDESQPIFDVAGLAYLIAPESTKCLFSDTDRVGMDTKIHRRAYETVDLFEQRI
jgi:hypothetical protein